MISHDFLKGRFTPKQSDNATRPQRFTGSESEGESENSELRGGFGKG